MKTNYWSNIKLILGSVILLVIVLNDKGLISANKILVDIKTKIISVELDYEHETQLMEKQMNEDQTHA